jgi:adenosylcobinamide-GDP ribazoletransferase
MARHFHALGLAVQFLTRLPVPRGIVYSPENLGGSVVFYPLVGLLLGVLLLLLREAFGDGLPLLAAASVLTAWALLTGGLHLDGLADCADAWVGGQGDRERSLRIMKDPCSGPIAVAAVVLLLLVKFSALAELPAPAAFWPLLAAPLLGRGWVPLLLLTTPYVRPQGLGSPLAEHLPRLPAALAAALAWLCAFAWLGPWPVFAAAVAAWGLRGLMLRRLGGCTGDTLGAGIEIIEAVVLAVSAITLSV